MNTNYYNNQPYPQTSHIQMGNALNNINKNSNNNMINNDTMLSMEQSYIENILRLNRGKLATLYFSFPDSVEWRDKTFTGIIEAAGRDHIIVSDPKTGRWYLLLMIYLNYVDFDEKINYSPEYYPLNNN